MLRQWIAMVTSVSFVVLYRFFPVTGFAGYQNCRECYYWRVRVFFGYLELYALGFSRGVDIAQ